MWLRVHLTLLLWIAGCAEQALVVPASDWGLVPPDRRATIDKQHEADLAAARAELAAATASLAELPGPAAAPKPAAAQPPASRDAEERGREQARISALGRVRTAEADVQRRDRQRRELRVEAARARIAMIEAQRELVRAQAVNRALPGDETYDSAPHRGQFSRAQQRWYALSERTRSARAAFARASADLAAAKEAYAEVMRNGAPPPLVPVVAEVDHPLQLELPGWRISRSDIARRRGLGRLLDDVGRPQLRVSVTRLSPAGRTARPPARPGARATSAVAPVSGALAGAPAERTGAATATASVRSPDTAATAQVERPERAAAPAAIAGARASEAARTPPIARPEASVSATVAPLRAPGAGSTATAARASSTRTPPAPAAIDRATPAAVAAPIAVKPVVSPAAPSATSAAKPVERPAP